MIRTLFVAVALACAPAAAQAADQLKVAPASLDPARGYVLVRLGERAPGVWNYISLAPYDEAAEDLAGKGRAKARPVPKGADKGVVVREKPFLSEGGSHRTHLVTLTPGRYVIASSPTTCFCLGSYSVEVRPGTITDLGHIYIGAENGSSPWAALAKLHSSPDIEARGYTVADAMAIVSVAAESPVPPELAALPRTPAEFKPVARFGNHGGQLINRALPLGAK